MRNAISMVVAAIGALSASGPLRAQQIPDPQTMADVERAVAQAQGAIDQLNATGMKELQENLSRLPLLAFVPQSADDRVRDAQDRIREAQDRSREAEDRIREMDDQYRDGTSLIDERRYERAIDRFDRVIERKSPRADGAYYWKAYALNKLGKRDEALAALAEIPKQFPQSRWINDAKALQVEIQQASGTAVPPEGQSDEDLKLLAINSLINSEPERAIPLLEKVVNDPKNNIGIRGRALFVLAQNRSDKARDIVAQYAKSGANPDLQLRAVSYLGAFRSQGSQQVLSDIYVANSDVSVRRAVLRGLMNSRDAAHLESVARSEQNPDLRREAIRDLGMIRATAELAQLYSSESNVDLKGTIIEAIWMARDSDKLVDLAKNEKDARLRGVAIQRLGLMHDPKASDALAAMYGRETDKTLKAQIVVALAQGGGCKQLVDTMRAEKDPGLKADGVRRLGMMHGCKEATDYLMELISK